MVVMVMMTSHLQEADLIFGEFTSNDLEKFEKRKIFRTMALANRKRENSPQTQFTGQ